MNGAWRQTLRGRHLASVTIHREPEHQMVTMGTLYGAGGRLIPAPGWRPGAHLHALIPVLTKPYIHLLYLPRHAEPWMVQPESIIPPVWLARRGFHNMEHFDIKVGLAPDGLDARL